MVFAAVGLLSRPTGQHKVRFIRGCVVVRLSLRASFGGDGESIVYDCCRGEHAQTCSPCTHERLQIVGVSDLWVICIEIVLRGVGWRVRQECAVELLSVVY